MTHTVVQPPAFPRRDRPKLAHTFRYYAPVGRVHGPAAVHVRAGSRHLSLTALALGISSLVFGFTVLVPIAGIVVGIVAVEEEPNRKSLAMTGIATSVLAGVLWAAVMPTLLYLMFR